MSELSSSWFLQEAEKLVSEARNEGLTIRVLGAVAIRLHCKKYSDLHVRLKRLESATDFTDLDFMTTSNFTSKLPHFFAKRHYNMQAGGISLAVQGFGRQMYIGPQGVKMDLFSDRLVMCHTIDFKGRLDLDLPTITLADLLLEKIQIVEINMKDIKDVTVLLLEHALGENNNETIDCKYISKLLAKDWGFYYTATENLRKISNQLTNLDNAVFDDASREDVSAKIQTILQKIEDEPKSFQWKTRSKIGTRTKWYNDVVGST